MICPRGVPRGVHAPFYLHQAALTSFLLSPQMYMTMGNWGQAYNEFYEGFRNYQEAGNPNAKVK